MKRKKCYIYTRVSTVAQTEGFSLEAQQERLKEYADYKNLEIAGEYCDAGKSGKSIVGRPSFLQMLDDISSEKDQISYVLVFKLSRFVARDLWERCAGDFSGFGSMKFIFFVPKWYYIVPICDIIPKKVIGGALL